MILKIKTRNKLVLNPTQYVYLLSVYICSVIQCLILFKIDIKYK